MPSQGLKWTGGGPQGFVDAFKEYRETNPRDISALVAHQAPQLANDLFLETYKARKEDIEGKVKSLGWRVKRPAYDTRFRAPKIHRAMKHKMGAYLFATTYDKGRKMRDFQRAIISIRVAHIGALRAGWIPAMTKLGSKMRVAGRKKNGLGSVEIHLSGLTPYIAIINNMPGIVELNKRDNIIGKAFMRRAADMRTYVARKRSERLIRTWKRQGNVQVSY